MSKWCKYIIGSFIFLGLTILSIWFLEKADNRIYEKVESQKPNKQEMTAVIINNYDSDYYIKTGLNSDPITDFTAYIPGNLNPGDIVKIYYYKDIEGYYIDAYDYKIIDKIDNSIIVDSNINVKENYFIFKNYNEYSDFTKKNNIESNYKQDYFINNDLIIVPNNGKILNLYKEDTILNIEFDSLKSTNKSYIIETKKNNYISNVKFYENKERIMYYKKYTNYEDLDLHAFKVNNEIYYTFNYSNYDLYFNKHLPLTLDEMKSLIKTTFSKQSLQITGDRNITDVELKEIEKIIGVIKNEKE